MIARNECQSNCRNTGNGSLASDFRKFLRSSKGLVDTNRMSAHTGSLDIQAGTGKSKPLLVFLDMIRHCGMVMAYARMPGCVLGRIVFPGNPSDSCTGNRILGGCKRLHYGTEKVCTDLGAIHIEIR